MSLLRAREAVMAQFRPMLAAHDVTEQQWRVLRVLGEAETLDATELASRASILAPSLTRIIRALEDRGLMRRGKVKGDARRVLLSVTPEGRSLIDAVTPESGAIYAAIKGRLGQDRYEALLDLLEAIVEIETAQPRNGAGAEAEGEV